MRKLEIMIQRIYFYETGDCKCSEYLSNVTETGNCEDPWKEKESVEFRLWCYVETPSSCDDLVPSESHPGKEWSYIACQRRIGVV